ncbi:MAG: SpoIID/LytB domain-containing protein [Cellulosilyticaceae bacterium]
MKKLLIALGCLFGSVVLIPTTVVMVGGYYTPNMLQGLTRLEQNYDEEVAKQAFNESIVRVLAKTVPSDYEMEALKAQAIIVRTYMLKRQSQGTYEQGALGELSMEQMKNLWKDDYEEIYERYMSAVTATDNQVITYQEDLIEPIYHEASGGMTRKAKVIYGTDQPYLQAVKSEENLPDVQVPFSKEEVVNKLSTVYPELMAEPTLIEQQIQIISKDGSGYIESLQIGNVVVTGEELGKILGLASSSFDIGYTKEQLIFYVRGIGSGVGLSQNGANEMAKKGKKYEEILTYYYTNVQITPFVGKK